MRIILTPNQMRQIDSRAINEFSVPGSILMENAALNSSKIITNILAKLGFENPKILVFCGSGNNGGDGFAIARQLMSFGSVKICWIGDESKMSEETKQNFNICKKLGISIQHLDSIENFDKMDLDSDCVIDALIGVGGSENIKGLALEILKIMKNYNGLKIAIDVPTGLNSENGFASEYTFKADYTITMFAPKTGMFLNKGFDSCGKIKIANLGVPLSIAEGYTDNYILDYESARNLLPQRKKISSKFDYGKVVVLAGSKQYPGAAALTANAAIKSGAGLIYLLSTSFHSHLLPEVIPVELESQNDGTISKKSQTKIEEYIEKADSVIIGPGLSNNKETISLVGDLINHFSGNKKIVLDADGLRAVTPKLKLTENVIITPHKGEFKRVINNFDNEFTNENYYELIKEWSKKLNCIIHLKWVPSITTNGKNFYWNIYGNPGMASGGSGDVLSGIIGGLLAQGLDTLEGAALGSFIHSKTGDFAQKLIGTNALSASDLLAYLPYIFKRLER
ncbi:MAG: NAD(P)H-hydrate dehydratase [Candidatus Kapabacteria bacterium]|nr:NAD(P)H-hydrate dehydratase [Candidatus Kapabacteria bacterium]